MSSRVVVLLVAVFSVLVAFSGSAEAAPPNATAVSLTASSANEAGAAGSVGPLTAFSPVTVTYDIDTTLDWTTVWIDSIETISNVLCSKIYDGGAGNPTVTPGSNYITISKSGNFNRVEYSCQATLSGLVTGGSYVDYRITKGDGHWVGFTFDPGYTRIKIMANGFWIASRTDGWDIPGNAENDLKFSVPDDAHVSGNLQREMLYSVTTTSDWTQIRLTGEETFSGGFYTTTQGTAGLSVAMTSTALTITKNANDGTQVNVLFDTTLNHLRVGDLSTTDFYSVKYAIDKKPLGQTHLWVYAPGNGLSRTLIADQLNTLTGASPNTKAFNVLDNRHIFWDNIAATFFYPWFDNPNVHPGEAWNAWNQDGHNPPGQWASRYMPDFVDAFTATNLYDSGDPQVIRWQLTKMRQAGIELAVASWWGQTHWTNTNLRAIMDVMKSSDNPYPMLKWAIYYEPWADQNRPSRPNASEISSDIRFIIDTYANSADYGPYYARIDGKPAIFLYSVPCDDNTVRDSFYQAKQDLKSKGYYVYFAADIQYRCIIYSPNGHYQLYTYDSYHYYYPGGRSGCTDTYTSDSPQGDSCDVAPGYWKWSDNQPMADRNADFYEDRFRGIVDQVLGSQSSARFVFIETWNEWGEGTSIEPGRDIKHYTGTTPFEDCTSTNYEYCASVPGPDWNEAFLVRTWNQISRFKVFSYPVPTAPGTPTWTAGDQNDASFTLSWTAPNSYVGIQAYEIQQQFNGGAWVSLSTSLTSPSYLAQVYGGGAYGYRVRAKDYAGNWGAFSGTAVVNVPAPDFTLSTCGSMTMYKDGYTQQDCAITLKSVGGWSGTITITVTPPTGSGVPTFIRVLPNPATVSKGGTTTGQVTVKAGTTTGSYTFTVTATSGGLTHTATFTVTLIVIPPPPPPPPGGKRCPPICPT